MIKLLILKKEIMDAFKKNDYLEQSREFYKNESNVDIIKLVFYYLICINRYLKHRTWAYFYDGYRRFGKLINALDFDLNLTYTHFNFHIHHLTVLETFFKFNPYDKKNIPTDYQKRLLPLKKLYNGVSDYNIMKRLLLTELYFIFLKNTDYRNLEFFVRQRGIISLYDGCKNELHFNEIHQIINIKSKEDIDKLKNLASLGKISMKKQINKLESKLDKFEHIINDANEDEITSFLFKLFIQTMGFDLANIKNKSKFALTIYFFTMSFFKEENELKEEYDNINSNSLLREAIEKKAIRLLNSSLL